MSRLEREYPELYAEVHKDIDEHDAKTCAAIDKKLEAQKRKAIKLIREAMKALIKRKENREWTGVQNEIMRCKRVARWVIKYKYLTRYQRAMLQYWIKPDNTSTILTDWFLANRTGKKHRRYPGERDVSGTPNAFVEIGQVRRPIFVEDEENLDSTSS